MRGSKLGASNDYAVSWRGGVVGIPRKKDRESDMVLPECGQVKKKFTKDIPYDQLHAGLVEIGEVTKRRIVRKGRGRKKRRNGSSQLLHQARWLKRRRRTYYLQLMCLTKKKAVNCPLGPQGRRGWARSLEKESTKKRFSRVGHGFSI